MCGIIGIVGKAPVTDRILDSLKRLEYRGYDSAGVAVQHGGLVQRRRAQGKIRALEAVLVEQPLTATVGIGHTRWATHGAPSERNAHPQTGGRVTLVHNGIIENFAELKAELQAAGRTFESDTDTEVIAQLIDSCLAAGQAPLAAFKSSLDRLTGAYALAVLIEGEDNFIMGARRGSPLVVGTGDGEMFLGSDALAVGPFTNRVTYLEEGDYVAIDHDRAEIFDERGTPVDRPMKIVSASAALVEKGNYRHFMEKEIHDQPEGCQRTIAAYIDAVAGRTAMPGGVDLAALERIQIVACGTSYIAGVVGKYLIEKLADLPVDVEIASEFRYREPALRPGALAIAMSQSGETADTLAALRHCKARGMKTAAVVNAQESTMAREVDVVWPIHCGPEIGVASTKAFTAQVSVLTALAVAAARGRRPGAGPDRRRRGAEAGAGAARGAPADRRVNRAGRGGADRGRRRGQGSRRALSRSRANVGVGFGRRPEAQGNQLYPCRRLCCGRTEARTDRAGRRAHADHHPGAVRQLFRKVGQQHERGDGPRRPGGVHHRPRRRETRPRRSQGGDDRPRQRPADFRPRHGRANPVARLSRSCPERGRCRSAPQPRQIRDRRVDLPPMKPVRKAVLPVAGLGTRVLPGAKTTPKEMLNVVDRPILSYIIAEGRAAGIEHFVFVTGRGKGAIEDYFDHHIELESQLEAKGKLDMLADIRGELPRPGEMSFVRQMAPLGLGHAVWCARDVIGDEPFAVM